MAYTPTPFRPQRQRLVRHLRHELERVVDVKGPRGPDVTVPDRAPRGLAPQPYEGQPVYSEKMG